MFEKCCVCNEDTKENEFVVIKQGKCVCNSCLEKIAHIHKNMLSMGDLNSTITKSDESLHFRPDGGQKPKEIKYLLDKYVVGQEMAKKVLSVAAYNHFKRSELHDTGIKKSNILLIGPTGSGKTYLVQTLAKILNVPLAITPATSLTEAGYIGDDVESCVQRLLEVAGGDVSLAEHGIIFIDEIDKLTSTSSETKRQVGGKGVQQALLPIIEGTKISVPVAKGDSVFNRGESQKVEVDTTNILFICGGAFPDAEELIKKRISSQNKIGFALKQEVSEEIDDKNLLLKVTNEDLKNFGLIPELLGRLPITAPLENLTIDILRRILTEPQDSIISQYEKLFEYDAVKLIFKSDALDEIAKQAIIKGTGARSLRGIIEELLLDLMFETPSNMDLSEIHITKEYITGGSEPVFIDRQSSEVVVC